MLGDLFDSPWKILIVAVVLIVLFGSTKLPVAARSLGRSMRILKSEVSGLHDDDAESDKAAPAQPAAQPVPPQIAAAPAPVPAPAPVAAPAPVTAPAPAATDQSVNAQQAASSQAQLDALQQQIRELKESSVKQTASVPADQKPV